jgi:Protein of unknown function (DUF3768)
MRKEMIMGVEALEIAGEIGAVPTCSKCGSERVVRDAWGCWNPASGLWELEDVFDQEFCKKCEAETHFVWKRVDAIPSLRIRELNDRFRQDAVGLGSIVLTEGIVCQGQAFVQDVAEAVQGFKDFSKDNDPWGEHDFGAVEVAGQKIFWKIDYYTPDLTAGSENPANEGQTHRVLTIMLAGEY